MRSFDRSKPKNASFLSILLVSLDGLMAAPSEMISRNAEKWDRKEKELSCGAPDDAVSS